MSTKTFTGARLDDISMPRLILHAEGLAVLAASLVIYADLGFSWGTFALLLLAPDLPLILYGLNKSDLHKRGASIAYNLLHTIVFPILLAVTSYFAGYSLGIQLSLIWLAHIGMDHLFGYGFKYLGHMKETHFSRV
jgi:hypothetical protein